MLLVAVHATQEVFEQVSKPRVFDVAELLAEVDPAACRHGFGGGDR